MMVHEPTTMRADVVVSADVRCLLPVLVRDLARLWKF
jgi:hypothetical protein